jgi:signal transduction histidine kinase
MFRPTVRAGGRQRLLWSFICLLIVPAAVVVWLGFRLLDADRQLEDKHRRERYETALDRAVTDLQRLLGETERDLANGVPQRPLGAAGALTLTVQDGTLEAEPRSGLLYEPEPPRTPEDIEPFVRAEQLELDRKFPAAINAYVLLTRARALSTRAGAILRLARVYRQSGRRDDALRTYARLADFAPLQVAGLPADLVALRSRCLILSDDPEDPRASRECGRLHEGLLSRRWRIDRGTFESYLKLGPDSPPAGPPASGEALARAAEWLWDAQRRGTLPAAGRRALSFGDRTVVLLWLTVNARLRAFVAGPEYQSRTWLMPVRTMAAVDRLDLSFAPPAVEGAREPTRADGVSLRRTAADTGLPWTLVALEHPGALPVDFGERRRMLLIGLGVLLVAVVGGGAVVIRGVTNELVMAQRQSDFVSAVSHEFRTPLTALHQFTTLLRDQPEPTAEKRRSFYDAQARATLRLQRLVESLLDFGRMEAGAKLYRFEVLPVTALVDRTVREFRAEALPPDFHVAWHATNDDTAVRADAEALGRAVWNLLENAVKYSDTAREITIDVTCREGAATIRVRDQGLGVPRAEQALIFDKFVRGEASRRHGIKGTGLGLAMVRHIASAHGGRVEVESEPGRGSAFAIVLPSVS